MNILFWLFMGFDKHTTSGHLLTAVIKEVSAMGHNVHVIQKSTGGMNPVLPEQLLAMGVTTTVLPFVPPSKANFAKRYMAEIKYVKESAKKITSSYDAVFIQSNIVAGFSVRQAKKRVPKAKIIYNVQDVYPQDVFFAGKVGRHNPAYTTMLSVQKYAYKKSDKIITISEDMRDLIVEAGADESKIAVIYNWSYQDTLFSSDDISPEISQMFDKQYFNVVYAGNIGLFQNVDIVVDAAEKLKDHDDIWFHIFGNGLYKEKLIKRASENGINNITFHPIQPHNLAPSIYSSASVNLIPLGKQQYRAALPSKTATCLACQRPVVFIIGKESKYGRKVSKATGCPLLNCDDVNGVVSSILDIKNNKIQINTGDFFLENCSITKNSKEYAKIIVEK